MGWEEVVIVAIIAMTIGRVLRSRYRAQNGILEDRKGNSIALAQAPIDPDSERLKEEVITLKERVAVLEKIATEDRGARDLESEIEKLRDR
ncbi:MAG: hypothetical protein ABJN65_12920 [Parasphingorhabdus sp.]